MSIRVLHPRQRPTALPFTWTAVVGLLLDRFHAPSWLWGVVGTLVVLIWVLLLVRLCTERWIKIDLGE